MKRTRRIQVIRYTQRSMVIEGRFTIANPAAIAEPFIEITHEDLADRQPPGKEPGEQATCIDVDATPSRRALKLRDLLRLRR
ncbi:MAG: hypothetical protein H0X01_09030 [Nitrospira sp.]|nr:hypothetical protein [Nitrospira sp.]